MTFKRSIFAVLVAAACGMSSLVVHAAAPPACDQDNGGLKLPEGFCALVAADGLGTARHAVVAPNGDLYIALQSGKGILQLIREKKLLTEDQIKKLLDPVALTGQKN